MTNVLTNYLKAKEELLAHVGLTTDWVECSIDDASEYVWFTDGKQVYYADTEEELINESGNYYVNEIYTQRFYNKHVFRGEQFTLIFCDPQVDNCKWWRVFSNNLERPNLCE